jgi:hypothetical protein
VPWYSTMRAALVVPAWPVNMHRNPGRYMDRSSSQGSAAFRWLDQHLIESLESPDEAFDWVFMTQDADWRLFEEVWEQRPAKWREAFAYVMCNGPIRESQTLLRRALFDPNVDVAAEAACTLCHHRSIDPGSVVFDSADVERLKRVYEENRGPPLDEVVATLSQFTGPQT